MKKFVALVLAILTLIALCVPTMAATTGTYNTAAVHLRSTIGGASLGLANKGTTCTIQSEQTSNSVKWYKVTITSNTNNGGINLKGKTGWSQAKYISTDGDSEGGGSGSGPSYDDFPNTGNLRTGHVTLSSGSLNVRSVPSSSGTKVGSLSNNAEVTYYDGALNSCGSDSYKWYKLTAPVKGFVASNYITAGPSSQPSHPQNAAQAFGSANLYEGCSNTYVRNVKMALTNEYRYLDTSSSYFDAATRQSVIDFQWDHHSELEEYEFQDVGDGIVGPKTKALLWKYFGEHLSMNGYM